MADMNLEKGGRSHVNGTTEALGLHGSFLGEWECARILDMVGRPAQLFK